MIILGLVTGAMMLGMMAFSPRTVQARPTQEFTSEFTPSGGGELYLNTSSNITSASRQITISFIEESTTGVNYGDMLSYLNRTFVPADIYFKIVSENADITIISIDEREGFVGHATINGYAFGMPAYVDFSYGNDLEAKSYAVAHEIGHLLGLEHGEGLMSETASPDVETCKITNKQAKQIKKSFNF